MPGKTKKMISREDDARIRKELRQLVLDIDSVKREAQLEFSQYAFWVYLLDLKKSPDKWAYRAYMRYLQSDDYLERIQYDPEEKTDQDGNTILQPVNIVLPQPDYKELRILDYLYPESINDGSLTDRVIRTRQKLYDFTVENRQALDPVWCDEVGKVLVESQKDVSSLDDPYWASLLCFERAMRQVRMLGEGIQNKELMKEFLKRTDECQKAVDDIKSASDGIARTTEPDSWQTQQDRQYHIRNYLDEMNQLRSSGHSDEWKALEASLQIVKHMNETTNPKEFAENGNAEKKHQFAAAVELLYRTAHAYAVHKAKNLKLDGDDRKRFMMALEIERYAAFDLRQLNRVAALADRQEYTGAKRTEDYRNPMLQSILETFTDNDLNAYVSREYTEMKTALQHLCDEPMFSKDPEKKGNVREEYHEKMKNVLVLTEVYLKHKKKQNDGNRKGMMRMQAALQLKHCLNNMQNAMDQPEPNRNTCEDPYVSFQLVKQAAAVTVRNNGMTAAQKENKETAEHVFEVKVSSVMKAEKPVKDTKKMPEAQKVSAVNVNPVQPAMMGVMMEQKALVDRFRKEYHSGNSAEAICSRKKQVNNYGRDNAGNVHDASFDYYVNTGIPREILATGDTAVLKQYLDSKPVLTVRAQRHLQERIEVMNHLNKLQQYYNDPKHQPKKPGVLENHGKGRKMLPLHLDRLQDTGNGCWSCAYSILLQGRGVQVDPALIRRYRPEISLGEAAQVGDETINTANSDSVNEMFEYASLMDKVCPNTVMTRVTYGPGMNSKEKILSFVNNSLKKNNAPVAFTDGSHWMTIIGYDEKKDEYIALDSCSPTDHKALTRNVDLKARMNAGQQLQFVALEDLKPNKDIQIGKNGEITSVYPKNGSGAKEIAAPSYATAGTGFAVLEDPLGNCETYYPAMKRNYDVDYNTQRTAVQQVLRKDYKQPADNGYHYLRNKQEASEKCNACVWDLVTRANRNLAAQKIAPELIRAFAENYRHSKEQDTKKLGEEMLKKINYNVLCKKAAEMEDVKEFAASCGNTSEQAMMQKYTAFLQKKYTASEVYRNKINALVTGGKVPVHKAQNTGNQHGQPKDNTVKKPSCTMSLAK